MSDIIIESFVVESRWNEESATRKSLLGFLTSGWGNGYAVIPKDHPCFGMHYDDIEDQYGDIIDVNGGLTYSGSAEGWEGVSEVYRNEDHWVVGFDTCHHMDTIARWPKEAVEQEARELAGQLYMIHLKHERDKNRINEQ